MHEIPGRYPFHGVRVLDLSTGIAGGYCTKLLADAGADVIKIEPSRGDPLRGHGAGVRRGLLFAFLHTSKRSAVLDDDEIRSNYATADLVIESAGPGALAARSLGPDDLSVANPAATMVSISPFGHTGPWAARGATEFTLLAAGGSTATRGLPGRPFVNGGGRIGEWVGGVSAAVAAAAALRRARATGRGDHVDLSLLEAVTPTCSNVQTLWGSMSGSYDVEPRLEIPSIEVTVDGYVGFCIFTGQQWQDFCLLIGEPSLAEDPEFATMGGRIEHAEVIRALIRSYTATRTTAEVVEDAALLRLPVAHIGNGRTSRDSTSSSRAACTSKTRAAGSCSPACPGASTAMPRDPSPRRPHSVPPPRQSAPSRRARFWPTTPTTRPPWPTTPTTRPPWPTMPGRSPAYAWST